MATSSVDTISHGRLAVEQIPPEQLKDSIAKVVSTLTGKSLDSSSISDINLTEDLLYASIIHQRLEEVFPGSGAELLNKLSTSYNKNVKAEKRQPLSTAIEGFLNTMVNKKKMNNSSKEKLINYAFGKAQLDNRKATLARNPENPTTKQVAQGSATIDSILGRVSSNTAASKEAISKFEDRLEKNPKLNAKQVAAQADVLERIFPKAAATPPPANNTSTGGTGTTNGSSETDKKGDVPSDSKISGGPNDLTYKTESERDGKVVFIIPSDYRRKAVSASIFGIDRTTKILDLSGPTYGDDERPYFRGSKSGDELPGGPAELKVEFVDGTHVFIPINDLHKFQNTRY